MKCSCGRRLRRRTNEIGLQFIGCIKCKWWKRCDEQDTTPAAEPQPTREELVKALERYGIHDGNCATRETESCPECCGDGVTPEFPDSGESCHLCKGTGRINLGKPCSCGFIAALKPERGEDGNHG